MRRIFDRRHAAHGVFRMFQWLLIAAALYASAMTLHYFSTGPTLWSPIETVLWKLGHVTVAGFAGYWLDRSLFRDRISANDKTCHMRRAVIVAAVVVAVAMGL